jgi:hypothetical protein
MDYSPEDMAKPAIVIVQSFMYRGAPEEFSNKYHFLGPAPGDDASWKALADSLIAQLRVFNSASIKYVRAYGYTDGDNPSVWGHDYEQPGPPPVGSMTPPSDGDPVAGDQAAFIKWPTTKRNSRGKIVYARKYFHGIAGHSTNADEVNSSQKIFMDSFALKCTDGTISSVFHLCLPDGTVCQPGFTDQWMTTRTLKRRGKRPPT